MPHERRYRRPGSRPSSSRSFASLTRAASQVEPPWSGCSFCMRLRCAALISVSDAPGSSRSEEHTSELQSLMRISYAVLCLKKKIMDHSVLLYRFDYTTDG